MIKKSQLFIIVILSVFGLATIAAQQEDNKKDEVQAKTQAKATGPAALYSEPIMKCLKIRRDLERACYQKEGESQQIGCILGASKEMGLCFADYGAASFQKTALEEASELAIILQRTSKELQQWAENNQDTMNNLKQQASPFVDQLFNNNSETEGQNGQEVLKMLELFGSLFSNGSDHSKATKDSP